jgi:hypothetical protein
MGSGGMTRMLAIALFLASCTTAEGPPQHPLVGTRHGNQTLNLAATEYVHGTETGSWTAGRSDFRYKKAGGVAERCNFSLTGRTLVLSDCRLAGEYIRAR